MLPARLPTGCQLGGKLLRGRSPTGVGAEPTTSGPTIAKRDQDAVDAVALARGDARVEGDHEVLLHL